MKFVVDVNCLIAALHKVTASALALVGNADSTSWVERLHEKLIDGFESGILVATRALKEELQAKNSRSDQSQKPGAEFIEKLSGRDVHFLSIGAEDENVIAQINEIVKDYRDHEADGFLQGKDWQYLAIAKRLGANLATLESQAVPQYDRKTEKLNGPAKLPYLAWRLGVRTVGLFYVLQYLDDVNGCASRP